MKRPGFAILLSLIASVTEAAPAFADLSRWAVEQMPGGTVTIRGGVIEIVDAAGCTVWWRGKLTAPVAISYTVTATRSLLPEHDLSGRK